jgi:hypothetical protein
MSLKRNVTVPCGSDARLVSVITEILAYSRSTRKSDGRRRFARSPVLDGF